MGTTPTSDQRLGETTTYERNELGAATRVTCGNAMLSDSIYDPLDRIEQREIANAVPPRVFDRGKGDNAS